MRIKKNDLFIGIYIMCAILFFIISIPSGLLDVLLAFNIAVAFIILFNALYAKEVLDMASFPTILLFTTLFRISLNVSSTKLILTNGDAGKVVETFGEFVGGGNLVIGIICTVLVGLVLLGGIKRIGKVTEKLIPFMISECGRHGVSRVYFMLTNIIEKSTELLYYGEGSEEMAKIAFKMAPENGSFHLKNVVSRKKQLIPPMMEAAQLIGTEYA